jgi:hypothetical protein
MLIDQLPFNLMDRIIKKHVTGYHNMSVTFYPIIILKILKIVLPHQLPFGNNRLLYT